MAFKLKNIFKQLKKGQQERGMFSEKGKAERKEMRKTGESKFQYDVRKSRERSKLAKTQQTKTSPPETPDPKSRLNIGREASTPSWEWKTQERNPGDLREQHSWSSTRLPSAPGDEWKYEINQNDDDTPELWAWDPGGKLHIVEPGSDSDKAIRERYTGSETGGLENWYGHDTQTSTGSYSSTDQSWEYTDLERKSYLPYDLAQKHYNPKYKGSKK